MTNHFPLKKRVPVSPNGHPFSAIALLALFSALLVSCGGTKDTPENREANSDADLTVDESRDNTEAVEAYYAANPDFFTFATPEDIPADLTWENGMDLPELGSDEATKGGTQHDWLPDFPRTFRSIGPDSNGGFRAVYLSDLQMRFARRHPNVEEGFYPGLAKEWAIDQENARVFVRLNPDAKFSDGHPVTSDDLLFSFYFRRTEFNQAPFEQEFYVKQYKNVTKYDDLTFSITVAEQKPDFFDYVLSLGVEPQHFFKGYQEDFTSYYNWKIRPTTAPYVIDPNSVRKGKGLALDRDKDWWAKDMKFYKNRYNPDRLEIQVIRDPEKMYERFLAGDLEISQLNLAKSWYEKLPNDSPLVQNGYIRKVSFYNRVPTSGLGLYLNTNMQPLDDLDIRIGLAYATDFKTVIDKFFRGDWLPQRSYLTGYGESMEVELGAREFDPVKAAEYFAKAGYKERGPDGIFQNDAGNRLSFEISTGYKSLTDALTIIQQQARKAGVEIKLDITDATASWKKTQEKKHQIALVMFGHGSTDFYPVYWQTWHGNRAVNDDGTPKVQTNNLSMINDETLSATIDQYQESQDPGKKAELAKDIERQIWESGTYIYGAYKPLIRVGYWRGIEWPEDFNVMRTDRHDEYMLHWIDEEKLAETMEAAKTGSPTFDPVIEVYDQFK